MRVKKIKTLHKTKLAIFNGHKKIKLALQHTYVLKMADKGGKMSWTAEVSLFFVSEMEGEHLQYKIRREHPGNDLIEEENEKIPSVILKDIKCKYKEDVCETMKKYFTDNFHKTLFVLPNYQNHWTLPSALRQFTGLGTFLNDLIKSGYID